MPKRSRVDAARRPQGRCRRLAAAPVAVVLALLPLGANGQVEEPARFEYRIGGQAFSSFTSSIRLDSRTLGVGTEIRLEDDANLEERLNVGRIDGFYNFNARHYVWLAAYDIEREGTRNIVRDIRFGEQIFKISTAVSTNFEERVAKIAYGFNALNRPRAKLGPSFGLHVMRFGASLTTPGTPLIEDAATTAPLPVFGLRGIYQFADRWRLEGTYQWFNLDVGDIDGQFTDFAVIVEHDTFDRFGFGFGVNNNSLDVESGDDDFRGRIDLSFRSLLVYFKGTVGGARR